ncbi:MAG: hypothetical protein ACRDTH_10555 [Pseudonocardiaceae bacterium]
MPHTRWPPDHGTQLARTTYWSAGSPARRRGVEKLNTVPVNPLVVQITHMSFGKPSLFVLATNSVRSLRLKCFWPSAALRHD